MGDYNFGSDGQWKFIGFLIVLGFITLVFGGAVLAAWLINIFVKGLSS